MQDILTGKWDFADTGESGFTKISARDARFFCLHVGNSGNHMFEQQSDQEPISCSNQTTESALLTSFYCIVFGNKKRIWESNEKSAAYAIFVKKEPEYRIRTSLPDTDITHRDAQQS